MAHGDSESVNQKRLRDWEISIILAHTLYQQKREDKRECRSRGFPMISSLPHSHFRLRPYLSVDDVYAHDTDTVFREDHLLVLDADVY